ncbi:MAG TPA: chemotaxis protein CheW [Spirochaetales bacterium]|nr:chemotaxis protein CheW [Spirochaetales bacterium]HRY55477.1 chemotaxis protein CheW [Spirochaetia bacterium]HRZ65488.1 chemotaxis protein CheW [Spirochaetia bacterium]
MNGEASGRYLAFELDGEEYAVEVERVEVVLESAPITRVPKAPAHLRGVINYRGSVVPVADLKTRFSAGRSTAELSSVIVLHIRYAGEDQVVGVLADSVREVIDLDPSRIERPPRLGNRLDDALIAGIGERGGRFIVVIDIDEAFKAEAERASTEPR